MIRFALVCDHGHEFDGWFRSSEDFDAQAERGLVTCPNCGAQKIEKALMAPSISTSRGKEKMALAAGEKQRAMMQKLREMTAKLREDADYVGDKFAEEARRIHFGEVDARGIYGEASIEDVRDLLEDGVEVMPLPDLPEDRN